MLYTLLLSSVLAMPAFTSSLDYAVVSPSLFDSADVSTLNEMKKHSYFSLLFFVNVISVVEYDKGSSKQSQLLLDVGFSFIHSFTPLSLLLHSPFTPLSLLLHSPFTSP